MGLKKLAKRAFQAAVAPVVFTAKSATSAVSAGKSILGGDSGGAFDQLASSHKSALKGLGEEASGGIIKTTTNDPIKESADPSMPAAKTPDQLVAEEQDAIGKQYKESILNRAKGRYNNSLLGGGYF